MPFEDWESDNKTSNLKWIIITIIALVTLSGIAVAAYQIVSPPSDPVPVTTAAKLSKPQVNATSAVVGDVLQISVTLSDGAEGVQVWFRENGTDIGSDYTNDVGTATYNRVLTVAGTFTYDAHCIHP